MKYSDITLNDPNVINRFLQRSRFKGALSFFPLSFSSSTVLDFGGGDGELCIQLARNNVSSNIVCYEPTEYISKQAEERTQGINHISIISSLDSIAAESVDVIYSLEVFEHLPENETNEAIEKIDSMLKPGGVLIIDIPNELFFVAFYKGIFRIFRRYGEFDAIFRTIFKCVIGRPPKSRPVAEITPGKKYHFHHAGFDHRILGKRLQQRFSCYKKVFSPIRWIAGWGSPEVYYLLKKGDPQKR